MIQDMPKYMRERWNDVVELGKGVTAITWFICTKLWAAAIMARDMEREVVALVR